MDACFYFLFIALTTQEKQVSGDKEKSWYTRLSNP